MVLQYPSKWKFSNLGIEIPTAAYGDLYNLVSKISTGASIPQVVIEEFKSAFGFTSHSTSLDWAMTDLGKAMQKDTSNAVAFLDSFWRAIKVVEGTGVPVPDVGVINEILSRHGVPLEIRPPELVLKEGDAIILREGEANSAAADDRLVPGAYVLGDKLGEGGFGVVYRAERKTSVADFPLAIKFLDPSPFVKDKEKALARFRREVRALQKVQHRAVVSYLDAGVDQDGRPYLVMPLIQGKRLREATEGRPVTRVVDLLLEVLAALRYAHSQDVLHRDLKPSNVLVRDSDEQVVVVDFGCSYLFDEAGATSLTSTLVGSLGYIPPEVIADPKLRTRLHDVFSCGIMLYEVLARRLPDLSDYAELADVDQQYAPLDEIVQQAIAPATRRFRSIEDFWFALKTLRAKMS